MITRSCANCFVSCRRTRARGPSVYPSTKRMCPTTTSSSRSRWICIWWTRRSVNGATRGSSTLSPTSPRYLTIVVTTTPRSRALPVAPQRSKLSSSRASKSSALQWARLRFNWFLSCVNYFLSYYWSLVNYLFSLAAVLNIGVIGVCATWVVLFTICVLSLSLSLSLLSLLFISSPTRSFFVFSYWDAFLLYPHYRNKTKKTIKQTNKKTKTKQNKQNSTDYFLPGHLL